MAFFDLFKKQPKPKPFELKVPSSDGTSVHSFNLNYDYSTAPIQYEYKTSNGYSFGSDNQYPSLLNNLYNQSPLHSSIIKFKRQLTVGNGYELENDSTTGMQKVELNQLLFQYNDMLMNLGLDYFGHSRVCLEITWNDKFTRIIKVKRIAPEKIRVAEVNSKMEPIAYYYSYDFQYVNRYPKQRLPVFDPANKKDKVQLYEYQVESMGQKLYSYPSYQSALNWVVLDSEMSQYHKSNITNSLNPSMLVEFFKQPANAEEEQSVLNSLNNSFAGSRKAGRVMVMFNSDVETAAKVKQLEPNKLDETFLSLTDTIQRQICYGHEIDPQILGLKTPGSLGNSIALADSFNVFNNSTIKPAQKQIEDILNKFIAINGLAVKLKLVNTELFTAAEIASTPTAGGAAPVNDIEAQAKAALKGSVGGVQGILEIQKSVSEGVTDYSAALAILDLIYGISAKDAKLILGTPKITPASKPTA